MSVKALSDRTQITLKGRIDSADNAPATLQDELLKHPVVVVEMNGVAYISALGLLAFLKAHRNGSKITIRGASSTIKGNFSHAGMHGLFTFEDA